MTELTDLQRANVALALRNAKTTIEETQKAPLDLDQASSIYDLCVICGVEPMSILDGSMNLIDPSGVGNPPLVDLLAEMPEFMAELGKAVNL